MGESHKAYLLTGRLEGLSNDEAAEVLGITVSSLKSCLHRGRIILREYLSEYVKTTQ